MTGVMVACHACWLVNRVTEVVPELAFSMDWRMRARPIVRPGNERLPGDHWLCLECGVNLLEAIGADGLHGSLTHDEMLRVAAAREEGK